MAENMKIIDKPVPGCNNTHRDSIWTQNYTLAEITGILYKIASRNPESGTDGYMKI